MKSAKIFSIAAIFLAGGFWGAQTTGWGAECNPGCLKAASPWYQVYWRTQPAWEMAGNLEDFGCKYSGHLHWSIVSGLGSINETTGDYTCDPDHGGTVNIQCRCDVHDYSLPVPFLLRVIKMADPQADPSPSPIKYLGVGDIKSVTAPEPLTPSLYGHFWYWMIGGPSCFQYQAADESWTSEVPGNPVNVRGTGASWEVGGSRFKLRYRYPSDVYSLNPVDYTFDEREYPFTVFRVGFSNSGGPIGVNSDDENNNNICDRRESGMVDGTTKSDYADDDFVPITVTLNPTGITLGRTDILLEDETGRGVLWKSNNRGEALEGESVQNSGTLPTYWLEGIFPSTMNGEGIPAHFTITASSLVEGSWSEAAVSFSLIQWAHNTYYTIPHEDECVLNEPDETTVHVGHPDDPRTMTMILEKDFKDRLQNGGGLLATPKVVDCVAYAYIRLSGDGTYFLDHTVTTASGHAPTATSTAMWRSNGKKNSAFDWQFSIHLSMFRSYIHNEMPSFIWFADLVNEDRTIDDCGPGVGDDSAVKRNWLDLFIPFVPKGDRDSPYDERSWTQTLDAAPKFYFCVFWPE